MGKVKCKVRRKEEKKNQGVGIEEKELEGVVRSDEATEVKLGGMNEWITIA